MKKIHLLVFFGGMAFIVVWNMLLSTYGVGVLFWQAGPFSVGTERRQFVECLYVTSKGSELRKYKLGLSPIVDVDRCPLWITLGSNEYDSNFKEAEESEESGSDTVLIR